MATFWWIGGGSSTNWNATANTNWSTVGTGGARTAGVTAGTAFPTTGDQVVFDANSGVGASICNATISLLAFDALNFGGNLSFSTSGITLTISSNDAGAANGRSFAAQSGAGTFTFAVTNTITFTGTSGTTTITSGGKVLGGLTFIGVGGTLKLGDNLTCSTTITYSGGNFDMNGKDVTLQSGAFSLSGSATRVWTSTGGTVKIATTSGTILSIGTNVSFSGVGPNVQLTGAQSASWTLSVGSGLSWGTFTLPALPFGLGIQPTGAITIDTLIITGSGSIQFLASLTIATAFTFATTRTAGGVIRANTAIITLTLPNNTTFNFVAVDRITFAGTGIIAYDSLDIGNNTNITIVPPRAMNSRRLDGGMQ